MNLPDLETEALKLPVAERAHLLPEPPGGRARELPAVLQTALFEPDRDRVTLTWAGPSRS